MPPRRPSRLTCRYSGVLAIVATLAWLIQGVVSEPLPEGPMYSTVSLSALQQAGWTAHYDEPYAHHTTSSIIRAIPQGACVFVGASNGDVDIVDVGAFADTASVVLETLENAPRYARGMYWYFTPSESFGFSASSVIQQSSADVGSTQAESRVSWHLDISVGGYRAGSATGLNQDGHFRKLIYTKPVECALLDDVYTVAEDGSTPSSNDLAGVQTSLRVDWFQQHGSWATVYDEAYSHATQLSDVDLTPYGDRCVFVGAKASVSADSYLVGAFGPASVVNVFTSLNVPQFYAGVYWYKTASYSFGFSADETISQNTADTASASASQRLSWHLVGNVGGYRAGEVTGLNNDDTFRKIIRVSSTDCDFSSAVVEVPQRAGVFRNVERSFESNGWRKILDTPYSTPLVAEDVDFIGMGYWDHCVLVAAADHSSSNRVRVASMSDASNFARDTTWVSPYGTTWYYLPGKSFGFSADESLDLRPADMATDTLPEFRLSWHLDAGVGGFRAGDALLLNTNTTAHRLVYVAGVRCQDVDTASFTWTGDQAPTPATVGPTADGDLPRSVLNDVPRASLDNAGWTNVLSTTYGTITTWDDTDFSAHGNVCLMVGCRPSSDSVYYTAAFGSAASISQSSPLNTPHLVRGVYWYRTFDKSFGYAPTSAITQNSADTTAKDDRRRLSWHLSGGGGWRCGDVTGLNTDSTYVKEVLKAPGGVICDVINSNYGVNFVDTVVLTPSIGVNNGIAGDAFSVTAHLAAARNDVEVADFFSGVDAGAPAVGDIVSVSGEGQVWTLHVKPTLLPAASGFDYTFHFAEGGASLSVTYLPPVPVLSASFAGHTTSSISWNITASFSRDVGYPDLSKWNILHSLPMPDFSVVQYHTNKASLQVDDVWVLHVQLPVTGITTQLPGVLNVTFNSNTLDRLHYGSTPLVLSWQPPFITLEPANAVSTTPSLVFNIVSSVAIEPDETWFVLPDTDDYATVLQEDPLYFGTKTHWRLVCTMTANFAARVFTVSGVFNGMSAFVQYSPPVATFTSGTVTEDLQIAWGVVFSQPVALVNADDFVVSHSTPGNLGLAHHVVSPTGSFDCVASVGCTGATHWLYRAGVVSGFLDDTLTISLPAASGAISPTNGESSNDWPLAVDVVDVQVSMEGSAQGHGTVATFMVAFERPVLRSSVAPALSVSTTASYTTEVSPLTPAAGVDMHSDYIVEVDITGAVGPTDVMLRVIGGGTQPRSSSYPPTLVDGTELGDPATYRYEPPAIDSTASQSGDQWVFVISSSVALRNVDASDLMLRCAGEPLGMPAPASATISPLTSGESASLFEMRVSMVPGARACTLHVYFSQDNDIQPPVPFSNTPIASVPHEPATPSSTATVAIVVGVVAGVAVVVLVVCAAYAHRAQRAARRAAVAPPQDIDPPSARSSLRTIGASSRSLPGAMTGGGVGMMRSTRHLAQVTQNKKVGPGSAAVVAVRPPPAAAPAPAPANLAVHAYTGPSAMATGGLPGRQAFVPYTPYGAVGYGPQPVPYAPYSNPYGGVGSGYGAYPGGGNAQLPPISVPVAAPLMLDGKTVVMGENTRATL